MPEPRSAIQVLLSLPHASAQSFDVGSGTGSGNRFAAADPVGSQLGSGGGTVYLLLQAWKASAVEGQSFWDWLAGSSKLIVHGGGRSRRLQAYGPSGKPLIPIPVLRRSYGQRLDQRLLDFQLESYYRLIERAPKSYSVLVTSGDILLRFGELPAEYPSGDILAFGMSVEAEVAQDFGVFILGRDKPESIETFLQKPSAAEIVERGGAAGFVVDTGAWLLTEGAIRALFAKCGIDPGEIDRAAGDLEPCCYELYAQLGLALGSNPSVQDLEVGALTSAVIRLNSPQFYHLGTNRQLIESVASLQNYSDGRNSQTAGLSHPPVFILNSIFDLPAIRGGVTQLWVENSHVGRSWQLTAAHVITGVPRNDWPLQLDAGACLDIAPVCGGGSCIRVYGFDDPFQGAVGAEQTVWFGRPALEWFERRGLSIAAAGIAGDSDIHDASLFAVVEQAETAGEFIRWLIARRPQNRPDFAARWLEVRRISALELNRIADIAAIHKQRLDFLATALPAMQSKASGSVFYRLDLDATGDLLVETLKMSDFSGGKHPAMRLFGAVPDPVPGDALTASTDAMLRSALARSMGSAALAQDGRLGKLGDQYADDAFRRLRESLIVSNELAVEPRRSVLDDQIVWARSPVRLDLGGGWTDTPPYCLLHGGRVVNVAVDLNGQPPIQVFARIGSRPQLVIRSIDLGVAETVSTYEELDTYAQPGSEFALAKAALALSGFLPRFQVDPIYDSLADQLQHQFGGGIELSMVAAVPSGSGLGTSSILAATLLGALGELCGLGWDQRTIVRRALTLEQMLTTGGGWQDQVGGVYYGVKLAETSSGLLQDPAVRWLPDHLFSQRYANVQMLLYYTGVTRLAKNILQEIVRGMFLNSARVLSCLDEIGGNADLAYDAIQKGDYQMLAETVRRSWQSNKALDSGTNPPEVEAILDVIGYHALSAKLLGAGGGGYLLIFARHAAAAETIRQRLTANPPNSRARFVDFSLSTLGLQVTRS
jgi:galactokinase/mevalonate kinase-like predicted kinase